MPNQHKCIPQEELDELEKLLSSKDPEEKDKGVEKMTELDESYGAKCPFCRRKILLVTKRAFGIK